MFLWSSNVVECHFHIIFLDLMWSVWDINLGENVNKFKKLMHQRQKNGREYLGDNNVLVGGF